MISYIMKKIVGSQNERDIKKLGSVVDVVNEHEAALLNLSNSTLKEKTDFFIEKIKSSLNGNGDLEDEEHAEILENTLEEILPEAFATVREAARRTLGMRPFDVQIIGGLVLHQGKIAEMKTGEGKTLVAALPLYLNGLAGYGAHLITVNDYLARRDATWMGSMLVGTTSIEKSEKLHHLLTKLQIKHQVLNAKQHEGEAGIVAQAGRIGAVTIATNMAGRGTDIILGGNHEYLADEILRKENKVDTAEADPELYEEAILKARAICDEDKKKVIEMGGLHIIGTERHESRRIDNQLRGRAGRQGDPGSSRFFVSLEDDLMRIFASETITKIMDKLGWEEGEPIEHKMISKSIENAQKKVEGHNFDIRKHLLDYDDVLNTQRDVIYTKRKEFLAGGENLKENLFEMADDIAEDITTASLPEKIDSDTIDLGKLKESLHTLFNIEIDFEDLPEDVIKKEDVTEYIQHKVHEYYEQKEQDISSETMRQIERFVIPSKPYTLS